VFHQAGDAISPPGGHDHISAAGGCPRNSQHSRLIVARKTLFGTQRVWVKFDIMAKSAQVFDGASQSSLIANRARG
jgi:hypothetical protein